MRLHDLVSSFKIAVPIFIAGAVSTSLVFSTGISELDVIEQLPSGKSAELDLLKENDNKLGFYKISIPDYSEDQVLFIQVIDPRGNIIADKKINTKSSVNYFDFDIKGRHAFRITNISDEASVDQISVEYGDTGPPELAIPASITLIGGALIVYSGFTRLRSYITAHPEEKT